MNYTYMKVFYTVCKHQNISKAALELDLTQPALSRIISNIEKEYNTKLFYRSKNGVTLSKEGLHLYEMIRIPYSELEKIEDDVSKPEALETNIVHIGTTTTALHLYLFIFLDTIKGKFPNVNFRIYTGSSKNLLDMLNNNQIDFAFITTPFKSVENIEIINTMKIDDVLIAPFSYKDKIKGKISIHDLTHYPFILLNKDMQYREHIDSYLYSNGAKIVPAYELDNSGIIMDLVNNNYGLSFVPKLMATNSLKSNKSFEVDLKEKLPTRYVSFAIKKDSNYSNVIYLIKQEILESIK